MNKKKLVVQKDEYRVVNGKAYLTISEAAKLIGEPSSNLYKCFAKLELNPVDLPVSNGKIKHLLGKDFAKLVKHYANRGNEGAVRLAIATLEAGMNVYIYGSAGFKLPKPTPKVPTVLELARANIIKAKETVKMLENIEYLSLQVDEDVISTNKSNEYYPVSHVRKLNPKLKVSGFRLSRESEEMGIGVKQLYSNYDAVLANTYHGSVWLAVYPEIIL
jgi:hypothetical protein